jgi:hypothetical protein
VALNKIDYAPPRRHASLGEIAAGTVLMVIASLFTLFTAMAVVVGISRSSIYEFQQLAIIFGCGAGSIFAYRFAMEFLKPRN